VTAVQDDDLAPGPAIIEALVQPLSGHRSGGLALTAGIGGRVVKPPVFVQDPVAGQVDQQLIGRIPVGAEFLDFLLQVARRYVAQGLYLKGAYPRVP
jgi:hypothetical protein